MKVLRTIDLLDVLRVGRTTLECAQTDEMRAEVLRLFEQVFQVENSNFALAHGTSQRLNLDQVISRGIEDMYLTQFRQYYFELVPTHSSMGVAILCLLLAGLIWRSPFFSLRSQPTLDTKGGLRLFRRIVTVLCYIDTIFP